MKTRLWPVRPGSVIAGMVLLTLSLGGCSSHQSTAADGAGPHSDAGSDSVEPFPDPFVLITSPRGSGLTTSQAKVTLEGLAVGTLQKLAYEVRRPTGAPQTGGLEVKERWTVPDLELAPGDNRIIIHGLTSDQRLLEDQVTVTHNAEASLGPVSVTPAEVFVGRATPVLVQLQIEQPKLVGGDGVRVVSVDATGQSSGPPLGSLVDDGSGGDKAAGDGVFSGRIVLDDTEERQHELRVLVAVAPKAGGAAEAWSEVFTVTVLSPLTSKDVTDVQATQKLAEDTYREQRKALQVKEALAEVVKALRGHAAVAEAQVSETEQEIWWEMRSGIVVSYADYPAGSKGGGTGEESLPAILLEPYTEEFGALAEAVPVRNVLQGYLCPRADPIEMALGKAVTLAHLRKLHQYRVVFIDSHGGVSQTSKLVYFTLDTPVDWAELDDETSLTHEDLKAKRIQVAGRHADPKPSWTYGVSSRFVEHYNRGFKPGSLVHLASCSGLRNATMAKAFLRGGADAFTGFTSMVYNDYALAAARRYFEELGRSRSVSEAVAAVRKSVGRVDPSNAACRLACAPTSSDLRINMGCSGYTRVVDDVEYSPRSSTILANTAYYSLDRLEPDPAQAMAGEQPTVFHVRESRRSCAFSYVENGSSGDPLRKDTGSGSLHDLYPSYLDFDPSMLEKRTGVTKLEIDRQARRVKVTLVPEPAAYADDDWVAWNRWSSAGFNASEQHGCPFWGPVRDHLQPSIFEASGPDVEITETHVRVRTVLTDGKGQSTVELYYDLTGATK